MKTDKTGDAGGAIGVSDTLPTRAGFYWWRKAESDAWRMVHVMDRSGDPAVLRLEVTDVEKSSFVDRPLAIWAEYWPVGQWVECPRPGKGEASADQRVSIPVSDIVHGFERSRKAAEDLAVLLTEFAKVLKAMVEKHSPTRNL